MYRRVQYLCVALATSVLMFAGHVAATTITTMSFATWNSAAYTVSGSQFELNFYPVGSSSYNTSAGITLTPSGKPSVGFTFTGPDNGPYKLTGTTYNGTTALAGPSDGVGYINVATPAGGETAILLGLGSSNNSNPLTLTLSDGETFTISSGAPSLFGFSIGHSITSLTLSTTSGAQPVIDDFYYGTSSLPPDPPPTAEGATAVMIAGGLLLLFGGRRKLAKRREASQADDESSATPNFVSPAAMPT